MASIPMEVTRHIIRRRRSIPMTNRAAARYEVTRASRPHPTGNRNIQTKAWLRPNPKAQGSYPCGFPRKPAILHASKLSPSSRHKGVTPCPHRLAALQRNASSAVATRRSPSPEHDSPALPPAGRPTGKSASSESAHESSHPSPRNSIVHETTSGPTITISDRSRRITST